MLNPQYLELVKVQLAKLATQANFESIITIAFGANIDPTKILKIRNQWLNNDFSVIPPIEILSHGELGQASGGYAASEDKIFVSSDFLAQQKKNPTAITELLLEEIGHKIDRIFNGNLDSSGDEGDIFSRLATGQNLSAEILAALKTENDRAVIIVGGRAISIEQKVVNGTAGNNKLYGTGGDDSLNGLAGNDKLYGLAGDDTLNGGAGYDTMDGGTGDDILNGGDGYDTLYGYSDDDKLNGQNGNDTLYGQSGNDELYGGLGTDTLSGGYNDDYLDGGAGDDKLYGEYGNDELYGQIGDDYLDGSDGDDELDGGIGDDEINGDYGNDILTGGAGNDSLNGGIGHDKLTGGTGNDTYIIDADFDKGIDTINEIAINGGSDTIDFRPTTTETININLGIKTAQQVATKVQFVIPVVSIENIYGGLLNDNLTGNNLSNFLAGGGGNDTLKGGAGNDSFYFGGRTLTETEKVTNWLGTDTIADFTKVATNKDKILLSSSTFTKLNTIGALGAANFMSVATDSLVGARAEAIVYSRSTGNLFYNHNGTSAGLGLNGGHFATLIGHPVLSVHPVLTASDFSIVA
jgi:hypothetical protein